jgi:hypothetical protein
MKFLLPAACAAILAGAIPIDAQEAADVDLQPAEPATPKPTPSPVPELAQLDETFKQTSMGPAGDDLRLRVEWRLLRNKIASDPDLIAAKKHAEAAHADLEKRERLRAYYKIYYAKIRRLTMSPAMRQRVDIMESASLGTTAQPRVRPSATAKPAEPN